MSEEWDLRKTPKIEHPLIEEWAQMYGAIEQAMFKTVQKLSEPELQKLWDAAGSLSMCNCWYAEHEMKPLVMEAIRRERRRREKKPSDIVGSPK